MKRTMNTYILLASLFAAAVGIGGSAQAIPFSGNTSTSSPTTIDTFLTYISASFLNIDVAVGPGPTSLPNLGTLLSTSAAATTVSRTLEPRTASQILP